METEELLGASVSSLNAFTLLLLRTRTLSGFWSSGEFEFELAVALAAIVLFRESALLNAACERMARRRSPF
jgi:hypothetical protein